MNAANAQAVKLAKPRGVLRLMIDPGIGSLFWGKMFTSVGVWMHGIVAAIVVYDSTGSTFVVGLVSAAQFAPQLFLTPWSGSMADRGDPKRQILTGRALCVAGSGLLSMWLWLVSDHDSYLPWVVAMTSLVVGLGFVVGGPAMQSVVPAMVDSAELPAAMALNTAPSTISRVTGPAVGALVITPLGPAGTFAVAAGCHLVFFLIVLVIIPIPRAVKSIEDGRDYSVRSAVRHVVSDRPLLLLLIAVAVAAFGAEPSLTLAPAMAEHLGGGAGMIGGLSSGFGVGAIIGLMSAAWMSRVFGERRVVAVGLVVLAMSLCTVSIHGDIYFAAAVLCVAGVGFSLAVTAASTLIQVFVPAELRGRVMALWLMGFVGARPLGAALIGAVADLTSVSVAFIVAGSLVGVGAVLCRPRAMVDSSERFGRALRC